MSFSYSVSPNREVEVMANVANVGTARWCVSVVCYVSKLVHEDLDLAGVQAKVQKVLTFIYW
jgi:hypothetical protein